MLVNTVTLASGNKVLLLEDFLDADLLERVLVLCEQHSTDQDWHRAEWTDRRKIYQGSDPVYQELLAVLASPTTCTPIEAVLGHQIYFQTASLWADYPGYGPLLPHVENEGQGQAQIFLTRQEHPTNGTTVMNPDKQFLFTLPYRNNFGWYFDQCTKIMHSREQDVPPDMIRYSLIFWYIYQR